MRMIMGSIDPSTHNLLLAHQWIMVLGKKRHPSRHQRSNQLCEPVSPFEEFTGYRFYSGTAPPPSPRRRQKNCDLLAKLKANHLLERPIPREVVVTSCHDVPSVISVPAADDAREDVSSEVSLEESLFYQEDFRSFHSKMPSSSFLAKHYPSPFSYDAHWGMATYSIDDWPSDEEESVRKKSSSPKKNLAQCAESFFASNLECGGLGFWTHQQKQAPFTTATRDDEDNIMATRNNGYGIREQESSYEEFPIAKSRSDQSSTRRVEI